MEADAAKLIGAGLATIALAVREGRRGSEKLAQVAGDPTRYLNVALLVRVTCEMAAGVLVTYVCLDGLGETWTALLDVTDLGLLATNWQAGVGSPLGPDFATALAMVGLGGTSIPEPASIGLIALGLAGALGLQSFATPAAILLALFQLVGFVVCAWLLATRSTMGHP